MSIKVPRVPHQDQKDHWRHSLDSRGLEVYKGSHDFFHDFFHDNIGD